MDFLKNHVEALIFCSNHPIKKAEIQSCLTEMFDADVPILDIEEAISQLQNKYASEEYSFEITHIGGGYLFYSKPAYQASIGIMLKQ